MWGGIKPWLDAGTLEKVKIHSSSTYREALLEMVEEDQLPPQFGGTGPALPIDSSPDQLYAALLEGEEETSVPAASVTPGAISGNGKRRASKVEAPLESELILLILLGSIFLII